MTLSDNPASVGREVKTLTGLVEAYAEYRELRPNLKFVKFVVLKRKFKNFLITGSILFPIYLAGFFFNNFQNYLETNHIRQITAES